MATDYLEHEQGRWSYMNQRELDRRLQKITSRPKLAAFIDMAFSVATRRNIRAVAVTPNQALWLLENSVRRAMDIGLTREVDRAQRCIQEIQGGGASRTSNPIVTITTDQMQARVSALTSYISSNDYYHIVSTIRRPTPSLLRGEVMAIAERMNQIFRLSITQNGVSQNQARLVLWELSQKCAQLGYQDIERHVINMLSATVPQPEQPKFEASTVRVIRLLKKEKK